MAPEDARTAFLRHATSKITGRRPIWPPSGTLGFRGEALAAIAAVSRVDLFDQNSGTAPAGTSLHLDAGRGAGRSEEDGDRLPGDGTTILIRDLFFNTPARMKFLKSDAAEGAFIFAAVQKQALAHPALSICFIRDGAGAAAHPR